MFKILAPLSRILKKLKIKFQICYKYIFIKRYVTFPIKN